MWRMSTHSNILRAVRFVKIKHRPTLRINTSHGVFFLVFGRRQMVPTGRFVSGRWLITEWQNLHRINSWHSEYSINNNVSDYFNLAIKSLSGIAMLRSTCRILFYDSENGEQRTASKKIRTAAMLRCQYGHSSVISPYIVHCTEKVL
jgi:hypothetical protein